MELKCASSESTDPRVRRTRTLIFDALRGLLHEKRYSAVSIQDIAERATVNRATIYAHFVDKDDLLASLMRADLLQALKERFPDHHTPSPETLVEFAVVVFEFLGRIYSCCPRTGAEVWDAVGTTVQQEVYDLVEACVTSGDGVLRYFPGRSTEAVVSVISWSIYGAAHRWSRSKDRQPAADVCREIVLILLPPDRCAYPG